MHMQFVVLPKLILSTVERSIERESEILQCFVISKLYQGISKLYIGMRICTVFRNEGC